MSPVPLVTVIATFGWITTVGLGNSFAQQEWQDNLYNDPSFPNQLQRFDEAYLAKILRVNPYRAIRLYREMAEQTEDQSQKLQMTNLMLVAYEERLRTTNDTTENLNRKLNDAFRSRKTI